jgi:hypothetical protein
VLRLICAGCLALTLAACGGEAARAPSAISAGEAKALEEAAEMLDQRRLPPKALPPEATPGPVSAATAEMTGDAAEPSGE